MNNKLIALLEKQLNDAEKEEEKANTKVNQINKKIQFLKNDISILTRKKIIQVYNFLPNFTPNNEYLENNIPAEIKRKLNEKEYELQNVENEVENAKIDLELRKKYVIKLNEELQNIINNPCNNPKRIIYLN